MYQYIIRPVLFLFKPETIHSIVFKLLKLAVVIPGLPNLIAGIYTVNHKSLQREVFGIKFNSPVGLAAGLDKDADAFDMFGKLGFSFVEVGTVTPLAQPGNPKPRLFRLINDRALINRMGFNNRGVERMARKLKRRRRNVIIGGNIGKNKLTDNKDAVKDYLICLETLHEFVDYFVVNVSSPNTPNLRQLQEKEPLTKLLTSLKERNNQFPKPRPILLKIAPDLSNSQLDDIIEIVVNTEIDGIVATNTTIDRSGLISSDDIIEDIGNGGLSGAPIKDRATEVIKYIYDRTEGKVPIIGAGGIMSPEDAIEKLEAGASLIQLYTGFIYEGPSLIKSINNSILHRNEIKH